MFHPEIKGLNSVKQLREEGKTKEALQIILELEQRNDLSLKELLSYKLVKAELLRISGEPLGAIEIAKELFQEFQKLGDVVSSLDALLIQAYSHAIMVNITRSESLISQIDNLFKRIKAISSIDLRERESLFVRIKALIHGFKGEIQQALELNKRAYELAKDTGNKDVIAASLNNIAYNFYYMKEYDKALMYAKQAVKLKPSLEVALGTLIDININKGDIKEAKLYLDQLRELSEKFDDKWTKTFYRLSEALILKSSLRARDRIKAEDILKELALNTTLLGEPRIEAIINLCDLYLTELRITNDSEIINEIHPFIQQLLSIAEKQHLYLYLAETYFLQAKLSLLTLDLKNAKHFLTQAQTIADSYGMKLLAMKISYEHDKLLRQTKMWENLRISEVPLSERLKLAGLNEQMENMVKRQMIEAPKISDEEPVLLIIISEGGINIYSQSFIENRAIESQILSGFLTTIDYFIREMFSEGLDRAVFGDHTLVMKSISPFYIAYTFKGNSYYALKRVNSFIEKVQTEGDIWQKMLKYYYKNQMIHSKDIPLLDSLIIDTFINKN